jgi:protein arginine kinase activator
MVPPRFMEMIPRGRTMNKGASTGYKLLDLFPGAYLSYSSSMRCDVCGSPDSVFYIKPDGAEGEIHLCRSCAAARFSTMLGEMDRIASVRECPSCSWTLERLLSTGRLGCPDCARSFRRDVDAILRRAGRIGPYEGMVPARASALGTNGGPSGESLSASLETAILSEDFESAALIRDRLKNLSEGRNA